MNLATAKATDRPVGKEAARLKETSATPARRPAAARQPDYKALAMEAARPVLQARLEGLIATLVKKLMPPKGAATEGVRHSPEVYRADAIALLIAASKHMGPASSAEDRMILKLLREAQKSPLN